MKNVRVLNIFFFFIHTEQLLENTTSVLYGQNPNETRVPVYAHVTECSRKKFHVSYWLFFPFSQGKPICTLDMGVLGPLPLPVINNRCFGTLKEFGSHVGDWEHMSLMFDVSIKSYKLNNYNFGNRFNFWKYLGIDNAIRLIKTYRS